MAPGSWRCLRGRGREPTRRPNAREEESPLASTAEGNRCITHHVGRRATHLLESTRARVFRDEGLPPWVLLVGARGFEPLTSSVSRKRSPPELSARTARIVAVSRRGPESNRCARLCRPLPNHSATPPNEGPSLAAACDGPGCPPHQRTRSSQISQMSPSTPSDLFTQCSHAGVHRCRYDR
jgi:hypothetical protein